jgi:hypothetical protein
MLMKYEHTTSFKDEYKNLSHVNRVTFQFQSSLREFSKEEMKYNSEHHIMHMIIIFSNRIIFHKPFSEKKMVELLEKC